MGYGDQLLVTGWARHFDRTLDFRPRSPIFDGNPRFAPHGETMNYRTWSKQYGYCIGVNEEKHIYRKEFTAYPGELFFTAEEEEYGRKHGGDFLLVEPNHKGIVGANNRDWGWEKWQELARRMPLVQMKGKSKLGTPYIDTPSFRHAAAVIKNARGLVTTNGGLHHAAAAVGVPAIVIWGCYNTPYMLGYREHTNFWIDDPECEGRRMSHQSCRDCMNRITVDMVEDACSQL